MLKNFLPLLMIGAISTAISCKKNDDSSAVPPRDYAEVADENNAEIRKFMQSHFYNYEDFQNPSANFDYEVIIDTISNNNINKTSLWEQARIVDLNVITSEGKTITHQLYYIAVQEGSGRQSTVADSVFVTYKGMLLNKTIFEDNKWLTQNNWLDLLGLLSTSSTGVIKGMREGIALLKDSASSPTINSDGTFTLPNDYGIGIFIFPSGLGYFNSTISGIPSYSPLIYIVKLIKTKNADHDNDGIPSINEITRDDFGVITYTDCDKDGIPDYLDATPCQ